jgi:hypothetical protein
VGDELICIEHASCPQALGSAGVDYTQLEHIVGYWCLQ